MGSIVKEADTLTGQQKRDASEKAKQARRDAIHAVRSGWSHGLYPFPPVENGTAGVAFVMEHLSVPQRVADRGLAETAFEKFSKDGIVVSILGWETLWKHLAPLWLPDQPHLGTSEIAEWFGRYVYLPRLRDRVVLASSIEAAIARTDPPFGLARLATDGTYRDIAIRRNVQVAFGSDAVLLRTADADRIFAAERSTTRAGEGKGGEEAVTLPEPPGDGTQPRSPAKPKRFFATIELDPARPVARLHAIVDGVLSELSRPSGALVRLVLEIHADAPDGFPDDVVGVVCDNTKTLGFPSDSAKFETE